jgi:hypothetical protein
MATSLKAMVGFRTLLFTTHSAEPRDRARSSNNAWTTCSASSAMVRRRVTYAWNAPRVSILRNPGSYRIDNLSRRVARYRLSGCAAHHP